jgi:nucleoside-diphosphate-sugar epimerase
MTRILIAGYGYVGMALGARLAEEGHEVWGLRRAAGALQPSMRYVTADLTDPQTLRRLPTDIEVVFYTAAADGADDAAYRAIYVDGLRHLLEALVEQQQSPRRVFFTSSTAVYAHAMGEWVDETSPTKPRHFTGSRVLEGERLLLGGPYAATVLRFGGIYGPGRVSLIDRVRQGLAVCRDGPPLYTNRIHRDDCAGALHHLMTLPQPDSLYIGVDHEPADQCEVLRWLAIQLGAPPPGMASAAGGEAGRPRTNKRCCNANRVRRCPRLHDFSGPP